LKIGVIAGSGNLPVILTQQIKNAGNQVLVISITKDANKSLKTLSTEFYELGVGQIKKIINTLLESDVSEMSIIGKISKDILLNPLHLDTKAIKILCKLKDKSDASIFFAVAEEIGSSGIKLIDQRLYLSNLLPEKGVLTKHKPSHSQLLDVEYGISLAKNVAELGIGQTVVVKDQIILAIEAIEGTDEAIRRGGKLCNGGAVIAKSAKSNHDFRFDVPTIGPDTIDVLIESKASVLAIEYGKAFLIEPEFTILKANEAKIAIVVV
jgi:hypothetical protein